MRAYARPRIWILDNGSYSWCFRAFLATFLHLQLMSSRGEARGVGAVVLQQQVLLGFGGWLGKSTDHESRHHQIITSVRHLNF